MKQLPAVDTATDTFYSWVVKVNNLITLANTEIVTANNHANGATTTGKGYVIGTFGANTVAATDGLRGGNSIATGVLNVISNTTFTDSIVKVNSNLVLGANSIFTASSIRVTTSSTATQNVDVFALASYRSAKYVISITDPVNSKYQLTEIMLMHDGTTTYTTEYATLLSNTSLATFTSDISGGNVRLLVTPAVANVQINVAKTIISV